MKKETSFDKIYGCWLGKSIGGTIGVPFEEQKEFIELPLRFPEKVVDNDDLDLQLVWLDILKEKGAKITARDLKRGWIQNIDYPWDEYGVVIANLKMGLEPPVTGIYNNCFKDCMGAPIRSEIWACIAPGRPEISGWYAWQDAQLDHWDEGVYGEVFFACLESLAFVSDNIEGLIREAMGFLPSPSKVRQVAEYTLELYHKRMNLKEARDKILERFSRHNFTHCVQNIGFTLLGLLYGEGDFLKSIIYAVNCGYDTDCTGATAGAIAGIILGRDKILQSHKVKFDERIVLGKKIVEIKSPATVEELTIQTIKIAELVKYTQGLPEINRPFILPEIPEYGRPLKIPFLISNTSFEKVREKLESGDTESFKKVEFSQFYFDLNPYFKDGKSIFLCTKIKLNRKRALKIFPACTDGIRVWIDGEKILEHHRHNDFLPAPHRPGSPLVEVELERGGHQVIVEVSRCKERIEFGWIVADKNNHLVVNLEYDV